MLILTWNIKLIHGLNIKFKLTLTLFKMVNSLYNAYQAFSYIFNYTLKRWTLNFPKLGFCFPRKWYMPFTQITYRYFRPSCAFYTPVWKTGRIMPWQCPSVCLSVCPSVRPSVRPRFPDFSSTCFEISIWNLVYAFSRWHDISSLSCITIGSIWPSLQPKVGQTYFLQSWPHKSR